MRKSTKVIPNLFTTLNIFCGFLALINLGDNKILTACWLITIAAILDLFDGQVARLTKTNSSFGMEFDSIADVVSFGVAPSLLLYKAYFHTLGIIGIITSFLPLMCGGIRLARFNVLFGGKEKKSFVGLPIPFASLSYISFIIFNYYFWNELHLTRFLIPQLLLVSGLMLSKVEYYVIPKFSFRQSRRHSFGILVIFVAIIVLVFFPQQAFYPIIMAYIFWGIIRYIYNIFNTPEDEKSIELAGQS
ncbi:MAG TPA: CDP-diacylglycerol--serine O-phosphatidyltransferase [bacterium]|nr:CDP-diacylglycerol--serine O-phosphatidyltransferase [bacterium]